MGDVASALLTPATPYAVASLDSTPENGGLLAAPPPNFPGLARGSTQRDPKGACYGGPGFRIDQAMTTSAYRPLLVLATPDAWRRLRIVSTSPSAYPSA